MTPKQLIATAFAALLISGCGSASTVPPRSRVTEVIDGDTIIIDVDGHTERVRLTGVDTPELERTGRWGRPPRAAECFSHEAHTFLRELLPLGTPVELRRDVVGRDDYNRILAYIHIPESGIFVNYELVAQGFARPLSIEPNTAHARLFAQAARRAEQHGLGLWHACSL